MAKAIKDFVRNIFPSSLFEKGNAAHHGSKEYLHVENQEDSGEEDIVYPSEEMTRNSQEAEKSQNTSALQAAWNVLNLIQGTGTLGVPFAVMQGGYMSLVAIVIVSIITNYTGKLIVECLYEKPFSDQGTRGVRLRNSYALIGQACWKKHGSAVVWAAQVMQLACACVLYLLLVADFFNDLFEHHSLSYSLWIIIAGFLLLPSVFLNQFKRISWLSMFSVVALVMVFVSVIGYGVTKRYEWDFNLGVTTLEGFPVAWGIILFSFVCHPYLPGIEESMEKPEEFNSIMNYSFLASALTKLTYGFIAVLTFKDNTQQEISENLPAGALQNTANSLLGLNGMFSYALPLFTLVTIVHKAQFSCLPPCIPDEKHPLTVKERAMIYSLRAIFVIFTVMVAVLLPQFSLLMAVIGSISGVLLTLVFPCLFDVILHLDHISTRRYVINLLIVCVGVLSGGFGLVFSLIAIMKSYVQ
ncbi:vesicular inhibitory amino acid transporter-like [Orbicella faveolata]|uniref:vesicular inhibitory amino acid transporter-like n=1 Tax=Orbicella faveolata TaxID=48498 RepID=UPI0009E40266|nr:vesicular inhibitory amino acid transporter-like [Orbicella faveolata]XP_020614985.1 vesicular inhibitory amino acid transporter-like [Orbicella faveolata]